MEGVSKDAAGLEREYACDRLKVGGFDGEVYSLGECCMAPDMVGRVGAVLALMADGRPGPNPPGCRTLGTPEFW